MTPTLIFIYESIIKLWFIITGFWFFLPKINQFMWDFMNALHTNSQNDEPSSPKKPIIDNSWCNIDTSNIIEEIIIKNDESFEDKIKIE